MEPEGELREVSVTETITPEAPKDQMEAVFELGAAQAEIHQLRREVQQSLSESAQLKTLVADLEQTVHQTRAELSQEIAESKHAEQQITEHHHAKWWERWMAGTG
jgi:septal ring factor EnvC (AmiA/AmiB activator)